MYNQKVLRYLSDGLFGLYAGMKTMTELNRKLAEYPERASRVCLLGPMQYYLPSVATMILLHRDRQEDHIIFCATYCAGVAIAAVTLCSAGNSDEALPEDDFSLKAISY